MLATTASSISYQGNGSTTVFSWPYDVITTAQLKVYLVDSSDVETLQTSGVTKALTGSPTNGIYSGATVTFSTAPSASYEVKIVRDPELTQEFDFDSESDPLPVLNRYADLTEMKLQSLKRQIDDGPSPTLASLTLTGANGVAALTITPEAASDTQGIKVTQSGPTDGSDLGTVFYFNDVLVNGDQSQLDSTAYAFAARYGFGGSNMRGQRTALLGFAVLNTESGNISEEFRHYAGVSGEVQASSGDGGTDTGSGAQGSILGLYGSAIAANGATNLRSIIGLEVNTSARTGSSVKDHIGLRVVPWSDHAVSGAGMDAAVQIAAQTGAAEWVDYGIVFDTDSDGTEDDLFGASATLIGTKGADTLANGVDISSFTFTGDAFKSNGFAVDGDGDLSARNLTITGLVTSGSWTPVLTCATPGDLAITYSLQIGAYFRIGDMIVATCQLVTSAFTHTTASGIVSITGLPFTSENVANQWWNGACELSGYTQAGYTSWTAQVRNNSAAANIYVGGSGATAGLAQISSFPTAGTVRIHFTVIYKAAP